MALFKKNNYIFAVILLLIGLFSGGSRVQAMVEDCPSGDLSGFVEESVLSELLEKTAELYELFEGRKTASKQAYAAELAKECTREIAAFAYNERFAAIKVLLFLKELVRKRRALELVFAVVTHLNGYGKVWPSGAVRGKFVEFAWELRDDLEERCAICQNFFLGGRWGALYDEGDAPTESLPDARQFYCQHPFHAGCCEGLVNFYFCPSCKAPRVIPLDMLELAPAEYKESLVSYLCGRIEAGTFDESCMDIATSTIEVLKESNDARMQAKLLLLLAELTPRKKAIDCAVRVVGRSQWNHDAKIQLNLLVVLVQLAREGIALDCAEHVVKRLKSTRNVEILPHLLLLLTELVKRDIVAAIEYAESIEKRLGDHKDAEVQRCLSGLRKAIVIAVIKRCSDEKQYEFYSTIGAMAGNQSGV